MEIDVFYKFSVKYGIDSEIVVFFCELFVIFIDYFKNKWFKYYLFIEKNIEESVIVKDEIIIYNVDSVVFIVYIEKFFFSVRIKEYVKVLTVVNKSYNRIFMFSE